MQTLLKHRWAIVVSFAFTFLFGGLFFGTQHVYADAYGQAVKDCTYIFTSDKHTAIQRTNCGSFKDLTYKDNIGTGRAYTQTSTQAHCSQTIQIYDAVGDDGVTGFLSGQHESNGACEDIDPDPNAVDGWTVTVHKEGFVDDQLSDDDVAMAAYQSVVYNKLDSLINKKCKSDPSGYCDDAYLKAVYACTSSAMSKIKDDDSGKSNKFKDAFTPCLINKTKAYNNGSGSDLTKAKINDALGDDIYNQMKNAGTGAVTQKNVGDDGGDADSCNASGNPTSWIICPIYDGIGSLSDTILNKFIVPMLKTNPISTNPDDTIYKVWSSFRVWGDVLLVIGLLVVVFGQAIGGGVVDAYTAKKVLPRLLIAAILINLSIYIVALAVDVSNVVGQGVGNLMTAPLDGVSLSPDGFKLGIFAALAAITGSVATIMGALAFFVGVGVAGLTGILEFLPFLFLFIILPVLLAVMAVFVVLALRMAIIMALVLVSPVAFALYCLPNTEQYFRKWWSLLFNMLLVYPIIMVIFAAADILAYTAILSGGTGSIWSYFLAFLLQFIPLLMIPYAFKLAGGVLGRIHEVATGHSKRGVEALKGDARDPWSRRNRYKQRASNKFLEGRERLVGRGVDMQKNGTGGRVGGLIGGGMAGIAGLGNYEDLRSRRNKAASEMVQNHISTGGDSTVRALFARQNSTDGKWYGTNGTEYSEYQVKKARSLYGRDPSMFQAAYSYEIGKAANDGELEETLNRGQAIMSEQHIPDAKGVTLGAHWNHQQTRRELKHTKLQDNGSFVRNGSAFSQEVAENVSGYALSNMRTSTIKALREDYAEAHGAKLYRQDANSSDARVQTIRTNAAKRGMSVDAYLKERKLDTDVSADKVITNVTATANSLNQRQMSHGTYGMTGEDHETPVSGAMSGGPGYVSAEIDNLVRDAATNQRNNNRGQGGNQGGGGGIVLPGSPGFNVPPGSLPPGP